MKHNFFLLFCLSLFVISCEKEIDPVFTALNTPAEILKEKALNEGSPMDEYIYSIVLRHGLNGAEINILEANRLENGALGTPQMLYTGTGVVLNYGFKITPYVNRATKRCIDALEKNDKKENYYCGGKKNFENLKILWESAKNK